MNTRNIFLFVICALSGLPGFSFAPQAEAAEALPIVRLETNLGNIDMELYPTYAPITVENFLRLVDDGFYDGLIFHRVIANFMIQAGGFDAEMNRREDPVTIFNESRNGLLNRKQYVAMARLDDPDSAGTQFFINVRRNSNLDGSMRAPGYAVFAKVIGGWDVVQEIELSDTGIQAGMAAVPDTPIVIRQATRLGSTNDDVAAN
ncbi:MAG: peptidylprolyl isomerase [Gammaproteobacteria bacterium]|nr:peptidylprolyl isomerase [Gammaproteobacteria bacterium]